MNAASDPSGTAGAPLVSVVTGTFNEEPNIEEFVRRVLAVFEALPRYRLEIIVIDNASTDGTAAVLRRLAAAEPRLKVIINARNFGHIRSPYHAVLQARGDVVVALASDLQDPPELIPQFLAEWEAGHSIVVGVKETTDDSQLFFFLRKLYYKVVDRLADTRTIQNFTGFGAYEQRVIEICRRLDDPYPYFRGMIAEIGLPTARIVFRQAARRRGLTKNNFYSLYDLALLGLTNHSKVPLRLATMLGFACSFLSLLIGVGYLGYKLLYWDRFAVGVAPLVIGLFFFASMQLFFIGILGEYIGSIHTQVLHRPLVVERERINFLPPPEGAAGGATTAGPTALTGGSPSG